MTVLPVINHFSLFSAEHKSKSHLCMSDQRTGVKVLLGGQNGIVRSYKKCVCNENGDSSVYRSWQSTCAILTPICMSILAEVDSKCLWKENGIRKSRGVSVYSIEMRLHSLSSLAEQIFNSDFYVNHQTRQLIFNTAMLQQNRHLWDSSPRRETPSA